LTLYARFVRRKAAAQAALQIETETKRIRARLLGSISHDLCTPLIVMAGASSSLVESGEQLSAAARRALGNSIFERTMEMADHLVKVLQLVRLEEAPTVPMEQASN
jgi:two-component system, OmpR family, sensor histidine kinase KdpD